MIREDDKLTPAEKETTIRFSKDGDTLQIFSEIGGVMRGCDKHPRIEVTDTRQSDGDVVAVWAEAPVGLLLLKEQARGSEFPFETVSTPSS